MVDLDRIHSTDPIRALAGDLARFGFRAARKVYASAVKIPQTWKIYEDHEGFHEEMAKMVKAGFERQLQSEVSDLGKKDEAEARKIREVENKINFIS